MDVDKKEKAEKERLGKENGKDTGNKKNDSQHNETGLDKERVIGRQSAISSTVNRRAIADRILDLVVPMSIREVMETAKDVRSEFQELIKVKNVKAVLLGSADKHPIFTSWGWPRLHGGVLIKVELETAGSKICAIIDTGSQLNIARADIAALKIKRKKYTHYQAFTYWQNQAGIIDQDEGESRLTTSSRTFTQPVEEGISKRAEKETPYSSAQQYNITEEFKGLLVAGMRLLRVSLGALTIIGGWLMIKMTVSLQVEVIMDEDKKKEEKREELPFHFSEETPLPSNLDPMSVHAPTQPMTMPFEEIQYLARTHIHHPGTAYEEIIDEDPEMAIRNAVDAQWRNYMQKRPLDVHPSFSASPQTIYLGSLELENGQLAHDLIQLNSVTVLYNQDDKRPCTLTGHRYSRLFTTPQSASAIWPYEVPYPSDARLESVMADFAPPGQRQEDSATLRSAFAATATSAPRAGDFAEEVHAPGYTRARVSSTKTTVVGPGDAPEYRRSTSTTETSHEFTVRDDQSEESMDERWSLGSSTPSSLPDLISISDSDYALEYYPPNCTRCGYPPHDRVDQCPEWMLPPQEHTPGQFNFSKARGQRLTVNLADGSPTVTRPTPISGTPSVDERPTGFFNPDGTYAPNAHYWTTHDDTVLYNFQAILGLDPHAPGDLIRLRQVARVAEMQVHQVSAIIERRFQESQQMEAQRVVERERVQELEAEREVMRRMSQALEDEDMRRRESQAAELEELRRESRTAEYVPESSTVALLTSTILTHRRPFTLTMGLRTKEGSSEDGPAAQRSEDTLRELPTDVLSSPVGSTDVPTNVSLPPALHARSISPTEILTPASAPSPITERSVDYQVEFPFSPNDIIDEAIYRIVAQQPDVQLEGLTADAPVANLAAHTTVDSSVAGVGIALPSSSASDSGDSLDTQDFLHAVEENVGPPLTQNHDESGDVMGINLFHWAEEQMAREDYSRQWDVGFTTSPLQSARQIVWGPLRSMLDFPQMASDNLRDLHHSLATYSSIFDDSSSSSTGSTHDPDTPDRGDMDTDVGDSNDSNVPLHSALVDNVVDAIAGDAERNSDESETGSKRKSGENNHGRPRKRFRKFFGDHLRREVIHHEALKAANLLDANVIGNLASIRHGLLEGGRRLESLLVREKGDFRDGRREFFHEYAWLIPDHAPDRYAICERPRHPLLFDFESARLHVVLLMLRRKQYFDIAWLLNDLLRLQFLENYAIGHLLTAGFLDNPTSGFTDSSYCSVSDPESSSSGSEPSVPGGHASDPAGAASVSPTTATTGDHSENNHIYSHSSPPTDCDDGDELGALAIDESNLFVRNRRLSFNIRDLLQWLWPTEQASCSQTPAPPTPAQPPTQFFNFVITLIIHYSPLRSKAQPPLNIFGYRGLSTVTSFYATMSTFGFTTPTPFLITFARWFSFLRLDDPVCGRNIRAIYFFATGNFRLFSKDC
ncbi:hypothetical protein C8F04DRAFT_1181781 [Mycena alexandri]|uniref:Uncharacterized protein n=1 Tax=Mycena alexandri TaxID=1745969 RepID=A0AAD6X5T1_9AGAR|nr:hypothetical protein C8F04DRAFT_1181781 [Mycena alexandri]